jgi:hypothetical protein
MSGSVALRLSGAEELICRSAAFRQHCGAADALEARENVHFGELADILAMAEGGTLEFKRPCAILGIGAHGYAQAGQGSQIELVATGAVWVIFLDNPEDPTNHKASMLAFCDWFSRVLDEIADEVGRNTLWPFIPQLFLEPFRPDIADRQADDWWAVGYTFTDQIAGGMG